MNDLILWLPVGLMAIVLVFMLQWFLHAMWLHFTEFKPLARQFEDYKKRFDG